MVALPLGKLFVFMLAIIFFIVSLFSFHFIHWIQWIKSSCYCACQTSTLGGTNLIMTMCDRVLSSFKTLSTNLTDAIDNTSLPFPVFGVILSLFFTNALLVLSIIYA